MNRPVRAILIGCIVMGLFVSLALVDKGQTQAQAPPGNQQQASTPAAPPPVPVSDDAVNAVSRNLYCPVCKNVTLEVCPTEACARWRDQVRDLLAQGNTEEQVRQYFIDKLGMQTVGAPTDVSGRIISVGLPLTLVVLIGGLLAFQVLRRRSAGQPAASLVDGAEPNMAAANLDADYARRLEDELKDIR